MGEVITSDTYDYLQHTIKSDFELEFTGKVSGYNRNTFKGRVYLTDSYRPVPFVLDTTARSKRDVRMITNSLALSAANADDENAVVICRIQLH